MKKKKILAVIMLMVISISGCQSTIKKETPKDDFYSYVNQKWIDENPIPEGNSNYSAFAELKNEVNISLKGLLEKETQDPEFKKVQTFYQLYKNEEARNLAGVELIKPYLKRIEQITDMNKLTDFLASAENIEMNPLISWEVFPDLMDSHTNIMYIKTPQLSLEDSAEYGELTESGKTLKETTSQYYQNLFEHVGYSKEEAAGKVENIFELEKQMAVAMDSMEKMQKVGYEKDSYHTYQFNEIEEIEGKLPITQLIRDCGITYDGIYVITQPEWLSHMNEIYQDKNLEMIKDYTEIRLLTTMVCALDTKTEQIYYEYYNKRMGITGIKDIDKRAIEQCDCNLGELLGKEYAKNYFDEDDKEYICELTKTVIHTMAKRMNHIDWMSEATKKKAFIKLNKIQLNIGYPEQWNDYSDLEIHSWEEGSTLFDAKIAIDQYMRDINNERVGKEVNQKLWTEMYVHTVNAFYNPQDNSINFPAAILQPPFYDKNGKKEENIAAIGVVIGHEMTHAFDPTGSKYDEDGNMKDWWTKEDYEAFEEQAQKVIDLFSKQEVQPGMCINGELTQGENIADLGGMACAIDILKQMPNADYETAFHAYAKIWRQNFTLEAQQYQLKVNVHSLGKYRVNLILPQFQEFYDTYDVKPGDGMYLSPEERLKVW